MWINWNIIFACNMLLWFLHTDVVVNEAGYLTTQVVFLRAGAASKKEKSEGGADWPTKRVIRLHDIWLMYMHILHQRLLKDNCIIDDARRQMEDHIDLDRKIIEL